MVSTPTSPTGSITRSSAASSDSPETQTTSMQCRYAGKRCYNARTTKRNGSLHNLCHVHRVRANQNQRRMELKRRIKRVHEENTMGVMMHLACVPPASSTGTSDSAPTMSYAAMMQSTDPCAAHWGHFGDPVPANAMMLSPPPPQDYLSDLFSAPEHRGSYAVDIPYAATVMAHQDSKQGVANLHYQFPTSFSRLDHQQVIWYDQDLLLPL